MRSVLCSGHLEEHGERYVVIELNIYEHIFIQINHLAVNALLKSNQVNEMEGGALLSFEPEVNSGAHGLNDRCDFDEAAACAPAFRVLKQLIQRCLSDAVTSGNVFADAMLQHLSRWLCRFSIHTHNMSFIVD